MSITGAQTRAGRPVRGANGSCTRHSDWGGRLACNKSKAGSAGAVTPILVLARAWCTDAREAYGVCRVAVPCHAVSLVVSCVRDECKEPLAVLTTARAPSETPLGEGGGC